MHQSFRHFIGTERFGKPSSWLKHEQFQIHYDFPGDTWWRENHENMFSSGSRLESDESAPWKLLEGLWVAPPGRLCHVQAWSLWWDHIHGSRIRYHGEPNFSHSFIVLGMLVHSFVVLPGMLVQKEAEMATVHWYHLEWPIRSFKLLVEFIVQAHKIKNSQTNLTWRKILNFINIKQHGAS